MLDFMHSWRRAITFRVNPICLYLAFLIDLCIILLYASFCELSLLNCYKLLPGVNQAAHAEDFTFWTTSGLSARTICQHTSYHPPPSPSVWSLLSLLVDVIVPLCSHFTMAILHLSDRLRLPVSPSACHVNVCFCDYLAFALIWTGNWEWEMSWVKLSRTCLPPLSCLGILPEALVWHPKSLSVQILAIQLSVCLRAHTLRRHQSAEVFFVSPLYCIFGESSFYVSLFCCSLYLKCNSHFQSRHTLRKFLCVSESDSGEVEPGKRDQYVARWEQTG